MWNVKLLCLYLVTKIHPCRTVVGAVAKATLLERAGFGVAA